MHDFFSRERVNWLQLIKLYRPGRVILVIQSKPRLDSTIVQLQNKILCVGIIGFFAAQPNFFSISGLGLGLGLLLKTSIYHTVATQIGI